MLARTVDKIGVEETGGISVGRPRSRHHVPNKFAPQSKREGPLNLCVFCGLLAAFYSRVLQSLRPLQLQRFVKVM